jgi:hypothetical protein
MYYNKASIDIYIFLHKDRVTLLLGGYDIPYSKNNTNGAQAP